MNLSLGKLQKVICKEPGRSNCCPAPFNCHWWALISLGMLWRTNSEIQCWPRHTYPWPQEGARSQDGELAHATSLAQESVLGEQAERGKGKKANKGMHVPYWLIGSSMPGRSPGNLGQVRIQENPEPEESSTWARSELKFQTTMSQREQTGEAGNS